MATTTNLIISIHAPVKGATSPHDDVNRANWYFNPRTREGCDVNTPRFLFDKSLFQSTHP